MQVGVHPTPRFPLHFLTFSRLCNVFSYFQIQGCIPGVGVLSATSSSKCASDVSCPLCGKSVYASVVDPFAVTVHDMQNSMSLHILRECTAVLCNIGGCRYDSASLGSLFDSSFPLI